MSSSRQGFGSASQNEKDLLRNTVWVNLRKVAKPDSRFHWDFSSYIPDYEGSVACADRIRGMDLYRQSKLIFITPDNNLQKLREYCLLDVKPFVMSTYGIARGFFYMERDFVPQGQEEYASTIDGMDRFSKPVSLSDVQRLGHFDFLVTGASAINYQGVRFGKGHGYFDLEWAMFRDIGVVDDHTPIIAVGHDCQLMDKEFPVAEYDTIIDLIITPTRTIKVATRYPKPKGVYWSKLPEEMLRAIPPLQELHEMLLSKGNNLTGLL
ncbi:MAG: methenyltetrahydrofolate synthetase [Chloroflexi bacterium]|nr:methenyltetrahydrofolate synthetase [Chloroflexota bacterium]MCL5075450.1 methenyltetrahydrofolate synthetase [Chloroflexota bacterium]